MVSTSGAVPQNGSLAALVESKAVTEPPTKHSDRHPSGTPFQSWLAKVTTATKSSLDTTSPSQAFGSQERIDLLLWHLESRCIPPSYLKNVLQDFFGGGGRRFGGGGRRFSEQRDRDCSNRQVSERSIFYLETEIVPPTTRRSRQRGA